MTFPIVAFLSFLVGFLVGALAGLHELGRKY